MAAPKTYDDRNDREQTLGTTTMFELLQQIFLLIYAKKENGPTGITKQLKTGTWIM